jgi:hypothetical protein
MNEPFQDDLQQGITTRLTEPLTISSFETIVHDEGDADLMKLLKRLAGKRTADYWRDRATGLLGGTAFGTSNE